MNRIAHSLVGYDRQTERVAEEFVLPNAVLPKAKELARVPDGDPDALACYRLDPAEARALADILKAAIDTARCDYFLEGFAVNRAIIVTKTDRSDGNNKICRVDFAAMDSHLQAGDFSETLGELPEPDAFAFAKSEAHKRGLPLIGPHGRVNE